jgi:hypothetical protein
MNPMNTNRHPAPKTFLFLALALSAVAFGAAGCQRNIVKATERTANHRRAAAGSRAHAARYSRSAARARADEARRSCCNRA